MVRINFVNEGITVEAEAGTKLSDAFDSAGVTLRKDCGGHGTCGKCLADVTTCGKRERVKACTYKVDLDMDVFTIDESVQPVSILTETCASEKFSPCLRKEYIRFEAANEGGYLKGCPPDMLRTVSSWAEDKQHEGFTAIMNEDETVDVQSGDTTGVLFGAAVDIGTTTVVMYVYNLSDGSLSGIYSALNAQADCGTDVISRIAWSDLHHGSKALKDKLKDTVNGLLRQACAGRADIERNLYEIILCGNSAMQHMFFGMETGRLGVSPFTCITKDYIRCVAGDSGLTSCPERCQLTFLPLVGGFVGADMLAVLLSLRDVKETTLVIDLGTNGELAVGSGSRWLTASAACGPALEGGGINCGMIGANRAIERVKLSYSQVELGVIGGGEPAGICGSGVISCIAELRRLGIIDRTGYLIDSDMCDALLPGSSLKFRLREIEGEAAFILWEGEVDIYITQQDIRQVQMAKSAIYSGCMAIVRQAGTDVSSIRRLVLAGAFGNYIDVDDAIYIGLLPEISRDKIAAAGNAAGAGASMYLLDSQARARADELKAGVRHMELANDENFISAFTENMNFN